MQCYCALCYYGTICAFFPLNLFAQICARESCFKDRFGVLARLKGDSVDYYSLNKHTYRLKVNELAFDGGFDVLRTTIYAHLKYEHEENIRIIVFILFDKKLNIDEVRLCELVPNHAPQKGQQMDKAYYKDYIHSIRKTKKKWKSIEKGRQVAMFGIHVH